MVFCKYGQCITLGPACKFSWQDVKLSRIVIYRSKILRMKCSLNWSFINYKELHCDLGDSRFRFSTRTSLVTGFSYSLSWWERYSREIALTCHPAGDEVKVLWKRPGPGKECSFSSFGGAQVVVKWSRMPGSNPAKYQFFFSLSFFFFFSFLLCFVVVFSNTYLNNRYLIMCNTNKLCSNQVTRLSQFWR